MEGVKGNCTKYPEYMTVVGRLYRYFPRTASDEEVHKNCNNVKNNIGPHNGIIAACVAAGGVVVACTNTITTATTD
uniref:Uncharacterized protein n=1 Tax=Glossina palpalis gambiensis TaxID=67801 RepID=A0A1B0BI79_9MUSC